mgnify:CR=1 FL=1
MKKIVIFALMALIIAGCNIPVSGIYDVTNGSKFVVTSKRKCDSLYLYSLVKVGDAREWYDYGYNDTTNFDVGDTLTIKIQRSE